MSPRGNVDSMLRSFHRDAYLFGIITTCLNRFRDSNLNMRNLEMVSTQSSDMI